MSGPIGQGEDAWMEQQFEDRYFESDPYDDDDNDDPMEFEDA